MYGVPEDLPLQPFVGQELNQICLGRFQLQLHWASVGSIFVEARWELRDAAGVVVDTEQDHEARDAYRIHRIIDLKTTGFEIDPPRAFSLLFESGFRLTVFDETPQYESFSVHWDGQPSMYV